MHCRSARCAARGGGGGATRCGSRRVRPRPQQRAAPPREPARSEDCLYANVWTSANNANDRRPVMVWIYGGGFTGGSGGHGLV